MRKIHLSFFIFFISCASFAQDFSNKGKDFWLGYGYHVRFVTNGGGGGFNGQEMVLYFATEGIPNTFTNIKIEIPALGYVENISNIPAGTIVTSNPIPKSGAQDARLLSEGLFTSGIHVTSTRSVVAYTHIYNGNVSGATLLFPTNTLGKEYYSINYKQVSNEDFSNSFFFVVAADTGSTTVEITPSANTQTHAANVPFTVTLNQGEIYNVMGQLNGGSPGNFTGVDLTGSKIRSISNGSITCKKIAVFSGSGKIKISCSASNSSDNIIAQAFPKTAWGKRFLTAPTQSMPFNYYRIAVTDPSTIVKLNGVVQTGLVNSFYYDFPISDKPQLIEANQPIMVAQYITTASTCGNNFIGSLGDPEMIYLSPVEQTIDEVLVNSTPNANILDHWINVIIKTSAVASFSATGTAGSYTFVPHPQDASYSYAQIPVISGAHTLKADSGFNAIAYGYGGFESYGYNAGTNLKDLYNFITPINPLNISGLNTACACTPFYFSITYPYQPLTLFWDFKGFQTPNISIANPVADSTYFINGKQVWRYKLPTANSYCPYGNYPLSITAGTAGTDGCGNTQTKDDTIFVKNPPATNFEWTHNGCVSDSVKFTDISTYDEGTYSYRWTWDFGDGSVSNLHNPVHKYASAGTYEVKFSLISNVGCISSISTRQIVVTEVPVASFTISTLLCADKAVTFTDLSSISPPGIIDKSYWNFGDGTSDTVANNTTQSHSYINAGVITTSLQVATASGCKSSRIAKTFTINPNPVAGFIMPAVVCLPYQAAQFTDASTIADGTQAGFSWKWTFGEPSSGNLDTAIVKNPTHLYSSGTGPYTIQLQVTSPAGCVDDTVLLFKNLYPMPTASFNLVAENCLTVATSLSGTSNGQGSVVTDWFWNFGDNTVQGTGQILNHTYLAADTFFIKHWIKTDKGCLSDTSTKQVIINSLPVPSFSVSPPTCEKNNVSITDKSITATGNINQWLWNFGNGRPDSVISNGNSFLYQYSNVGTYPVTLQVKTDKGCANALSLSKNIIVSPLPTAGFVSPEVCLSDASAIFIDTSAVVSGSITKWAWNFGDANATPANNISNLKNPSHRYSAIGNYTATMVITSNNGCVDSLVQSFTVNGDKPLADFTIQNLSGYCGNDSVEIKDNSTVNFGNITKVLIYWDNVNAPAVVETDDLPALGKLYKHRYPAFQMPLTKQFSIRYLAFSGATCVNEKLLKVTVFAVPKLVFNIIPDVCLDALNYQVTQAAETGAVPGTGVYSGAGINSAGLFTPAAVGAGTHRIKYTFTSNAGCVDSAFQTIKVLASAIANFGNSTPVCAANAVTFTDSSSVPTGVGSISTWSWNFGDGSPVIINASAAAVLHTFAISGNYTVTLTVTTTNGCKVTREKLVVVNPLPVPSFKFPASICMPNPIAAFTDTSTISDGTTNAFTYLWNFDDAASLNNTSTSKNPEHQFSGLRIYNVSLQVTSGAGCKKSTIIPVNTLHPQPVANFKSDSLSICQNQSVRFSDNSNGADGIVNKWLWDFGNGQIASQQLPAAQTYSDARIYNVVLQVENNFGCKDTVAKPFTVFAFPLINAGPDKVLLEGGQITLGATATGNGLQFLWLPNSYLSNSKILQPTVSGLTADTISYLFSVTAAGGCRLTDLVLVTLLRVPVIPNTFTPNGDGINENWTIQYLDAYPTCNIQVFNRSGQVVYQANGYNAPGWDGKYKGKELPFGTYYYVIEPGSGRKPMTGYVTIIK